jgi:outer membrane protein OmpA-like peptidoglycan-associated protein
MRKLYYLLLAGFFLAGALPSYGQGDLEDLNANPHSIAAKVLFLDYATPNGLSMEDYPLSNGLEAAYIRNFNPFLNIAFPVKVGLANVEGSNTRQTIVSLDAVLQAQYQKTPESFLVPYIFGGGSVVFENFETSSLQFPAGLGFNFRIGRNTRLNLQGEYRHSLAEDRNNLQVGAGLIFRLVPGEKKEEPEPLPPPIEDADGDGVADAQDECPQEAGLPALLGCPDRDEDGIADKIDECPDEAGPATTLGCPDTDEDGVADKDDECPDEAGPKENKGCPETAAIADADGDGLDDTIDECPDQAGPLELKGCPDSDGDGIPDKDDKCPNEAGPASRGGCPAKDSDGDGILDDKDECPDKAGPLTMMGCPDTDGDGIPDHKDECPTEAGSKEMNGCPKKDTDGDGILDGQDECPDQAGTLAMKGCPDTDGDGVPDKDDDCPTVKGLKELGGCPDLDADDDGVNDDEDECPNEAGPASANGCPDKDGDGIPDKRDRCPDKAGPYNGCPDTDGDGLDDSVDECPDLEGPVSNLGCPELEKEDVEYLEFATQAVNFETGKATLQAESYDILDQVAEILKKYPYYKVRIVGHTDNTGSSSTNKVLSQERAKSCYEYLRSRGLPTERLSFEGRGSSESIATNDTEEGRELNRRVEFELYAK